MEAAAVLGIFSNSYLYWDHEVNETNNRPRLEELASQAVTFLKTKAEAEDTGYFVMIKAGRIDQVARWPGSGAPCLPASCPRVTTTARPPAPSVRPSLSTRRWRP